MKLRLPFVLGGCLLIVVCAVAFGHRPITWLVALATLVTALALYWGDLHAQAVVIIPVFFLQTVLAASGEWTRPLSLLSFAVSVAAAVFILFSQVPTPVGWLVLGLDAAQFVVFALAFESPLGVAAYSVIALPFVTRGASLVLELLARRSPRSERVRLA